MVSGNSANFQDSVIEIYDGNQERPVLQIQLLKLLRDGKWIFCLIAYNSTIIYYLSTWVTSTNSLALKAYLNTVLFNVLSLVICLIPSWIRLENLQSSKKFKETCSRENQFKVFTHTFRTNPPDGSYSCRPERLRCSKSLLSEQDNEPAFSSVSTLGVEKYEVLALLASSTVMLISAIFIVIEVLNRVVNQPVVCTGKLSLGIILGVLAHIGTITTHPDAGLDHVVCKALPCPTLGGYNPISSGNALGAVVLFACHIVLQFWVIDIIDTIAALVITALMIASMLPLAFYTASVMIKKLPHHMIGQLEKCLRESLTIDGVLELRNEKFWTKSFGKLGGSLQVRIRKNADERIVLKNVMKRLSEIVSTLAVEKFEESDRLEVKIEYPVEYYIQELLSDCNGYYGGKKNNSKYEENEEVALKIDDVLGGKRKNVETWRSSTFDKSKEKKSFGIACFKEIS